MTPEERWEQRQAIFESLQEEDMASSLRLAEIESEYHLPQYQESQRHANMVLEIRGRVQANQE